MFNTNNNEMSMALNEITTIKISDVEELIYNDFKSWVIDGEQTIFNLIGLPGIGKTATVEKVAKRLSKDLNINIVLKHLTQADLSGLTPEGISIPDFGDDGVVRQKFFLSPFAPEPNAINILFFDEVTDYTSGAMKVVQKATDPRKTWGDRDLSNTYSILAGNTAETTILNNAIMNTALSNRISTIEVVGDLEGFINYSLNKLRPEFIAFVSSNRELLSSTQLSEDHKCPFGIDYRNEDPDQFGSTRAVSFLSFVWEYLGTLDERLKNKVICSRLGDYHGSLLIDFIKKNNSQKFKNFKMKDFVNLKEMDKSNVERFDNVISISDMDKLLVTWEKYRRKNKIGLNNSFLFFGDPGIGKTSVVKNIMEKFDTPHMSATGSLFNPVSPAGYLIPNEVTLRLDTMIPSYAPHISDEFSMYFLDELGDMPDGDGSSLIQGVTDNITPHFAEYDLKNMTFIGSMNPVSSSHLSRKINFPTINRCSLFNIKSAVKDTTTYFTNIGVDNRIISFIESNPGSVTDPVIADNLLNGEAFSSPRSLYNLDRILKATYDNEDILNNLIIGTIGENYGTKFVSFLKVVVDTISPKELLRLHNSTKREDKIKLANLRIDQSYLVSLNCSTYLVELMNKYINSHRQMNDKFFNLMATDVDTKNANSKYNMLSDDEFKADEYINAITGFLNVFSTVELNADEQASALYNILSTALTFTKKELVVYRQFQRSILSNARVKRTIQASLGDDLKKWISKQDGGNGLLSDIAKSALG